MSGDCQYEHPHPDHPCGVTGWPTDDPNTVLVDNLAHADLKALFAGAGLSVQANDAPPRVWSCCGTPYPGLHLRECPHDVVTSHLCCHGPRSTPYHPCCNPGHPA